MSILEKFKNLTSSKPSERDLFNAKKTETNKITIPTFAKYYLY
jgi:hypothetical protein